MNMYQDLIKRLMDKGYEKCNNRGRLINHSILLIRKDVTDGQRKAILIYDNTCGIMRGKGNLDALRQVVSKRGPLKESGFKLLTIVLDRYKNSDYVKLDNTIFLCTYDFKILRGRLDEEFMDELYYVQEFASGTRMADTHNKYESGLFRIFYEDHRVVAVYLLVIANILYFTFLRHESDVFGISRSLFEGGQYYRIMTYMFAHASIFHILGNLTALIWIGRLVEKQQGFLMTVLIYVISGIMGAYFSMNFGASPETITIGASGAVCGLLGANMVNIMFLPRLRHGSAIWASIIYFLITIAGGTYVNADNWCHLGGFIGGILTATLICSVKMYLYYCKVEDSQKYIAKIRSGRKNS